MARTVRQLIVEGNIAYVPLTRGLFSVIDASDADRVGNVNWRANATKNTSYAVREVSLPNGGRASVFLHRLITNAESGMVVDHIDGNGLNNKSSNLRVVTHRENIHNTAPPRNNTSGVKGVSFDKQRNKWFAKIMIRGKQIALGRYDKKEDAIAAYNTAFEKYNGWSQYR